MKQQQVGFSLVFRGLGKVGLCVYDNPFDDFNAFSNVWVDATTQVFECNGRLFAVKLHIIEFVVINARNDVLRHIVGKNAHTADFYGLLLRRIGLFQGAKSLFAEIRNNASPR